MKADKIQMIVVGVHKDDPQVQEAVRDIGKAVKYAAVAVETGHAFAKTAGPDFLDRIVEQAPKDLKRQQAIGAAISNQFCTAFFVRRLGENSEDMLRTVKNVMHVRPPSAAEKLNKKQQKFVDNFVKERIDILFDPETGPYRTMEPT